MRWVLLITTIPVAIAVYGQYFYEPVHGWDCGIWNNLGSCDFTGLYLFFGGAVLTPIVFFVGAAIVWLVRRQRRRSRVDTTGSSGNP